MVIQRALDEVFRSWSHVAVLRALIDAAAGCTGNEVARNAGMHPRSALKALTILDELGIVHRQRGGRDHLFTLNREHLLVRSAILPVYDAERKFPAALMQTLKKSLERHVMSAIIFGSVAKNGATPQSDLDLCCIVKNETTRKKVRELLQAQSPRLSSEFGVRVAPLLFTVTEFRSKSKNPLIAGIAKHGITVAGKKPRALLHG